MTEIYKDKRSTALEAIFSGFAQNIVEESEEKFLFTQRLEDMSKLVRDVGGPRFFADGGFDHINEFIRETLAMQEEFFPELETNHFYHEIIDTMNFLTFYDGQALERLQGVNPPLPPLDTSGYLQFLGQRRRPVEEHNTVAMNDQERHDFEQRRIASWPYFAPTPGVYLPFGELSDDQKKILQHQRERYNEYVDNDAYDSDDIPDLEEAN